MSLNVVERISCDLLVIGGGGAGLIAAITAKKMGADVTIVSKSRVGYGNNTFISKASIAVALENTEINDNTEIHIEDSLISGRFINDLNMLKKVMQKAESTVDYLEECGVPFHRQDSDLLVRQTPGHRHPRNISTQKMIGSELILPLRKCALNSGVRFIDNVFITRLFARDGRFSGAFGFSEGGQFWAFISKCCVLATGGYAQVYSRTNNAPRITGDGQVLALRLGIPLKDTEFIQFYPTALGANGRRILLYEKFMFHTGVVLRNSAGEDILAKHGLVDPLEVTRDRLSRALKKEISDGNDINGGLAMDFRQASQEKLGRLSHLLPAGWSPYTNMLIVAPTTHFCMGGIAVNANGQTEIAGLFAAGEVCAGVHGANRLGGNALTEVFVMGDVVGKNAVSLAKNMLLPFWSENEYESEKIRLAAMFSNGTQNHKKVRHKLKKLMWDKAGVIREGRALSEALIEIEEIKSDISTLQIKTYKDLMKSIELENLTIMSEIVCRAALLRTESRGAHYRSDFPVENNKWFKNIVVRMKNSHIQFEILPVSS